MCPTGLASRSTIASAVLHVKQLFVAKSRGAEVGGDFVDERAGVRVVPPAVLGLLAVFDGVLGTRGWLTVPVLDSRDATGLGTGTAISGGEEGGSTAATAGSEAGSGIGTESAGGDLARLLSTNLASWSAILGLAVDEGLGLGGHSRLSLCSILSASPITLVCEVTLDVREGPFGTIDWRLVCCSKRPMRLATLCLGRSSGNGLHYTRTVTGSAGGDAGRALGERTWCYTRWATCKDTGF